MSEDAYRLGRAPILDLLDAGRARLEAVLVEIDLRAAAQEQAPRIQALAGRLIDTEQKRASALMPNRSSN